MTIFNGDDNDNVLGGNFDNDILNGNGGNDTLVGSQGADVMNGGSDFDTVDYSRSLGKDGNGAFIGVNVFLDDPSTGAGIGFGGHAEGDTYSSIERVIGSQFGDTITGNSFDNRLDGGNGDDVLKGFGGNDDLFGGLGDDTLSGDEGNDILIGAEGADKLVGGGGIDTADYRDSLSSERIVVNLATNFGNDGDAQGDTFEGIENVFGTLEGDLITGDGVANLLLGDGGDDFLSGGEGNDTLDGQSDADQMVGGNGNDTFVVQEKGDTVSELFTLGTDTVRSSIDFNLNNTTIVQGNVENLTLTGTQDTQATGNTLNNVLTGNSGDNRLVGNGGADTMRGGAGDDRYFVENAGDVVDESTTGSNGVDTVQSSVSFSLSGSKALGAVENLALTGSGSSNINGAGNGLANDMSGTRGNNDLMGLGGNDELTGGRGADTFVFSAALNGFSNVDTITDFNVADDTMRLENAFMTALSTGQLGAAAFHIGASAADASDRIVYNSGTGSVFYDADGNGAGAAIRFAQLDTGLLLTSADFFIV
jgi:Ca2+-binding RTX toxin-like protein